MVEDRLRSLSKGPHHKRRSSVRDCHMREHDEMRRDAGAGTLPARSRSSPAPPFRSKWIATTSSAWCATTRRHAGARSMLVLTSAKFTAPTERIRREAEIPTMAVGLITEPTQAESYLAEGRCELVALAREMLWPTGNESA